MNTVHMAQEHNWVQVSTVLGRVGLMWACRQNGSPVTSKSPRTSQTESRREWRCRKRILQNLHILPNFTQLKRRSFTQMPFDQAIESKSKSNQFFALHVHGYAIGIECSWIYWQRIQENTFWQIMQIVREFLLGGFILCEQKATVNRGAVHLILLLSLNCDKTDKPNLERWSILNGLIGVVTKDGGQ